MTAEFVQVTPEHVETLGRTMRDLDARECLAAGFESPMEAAQASVEMAAFSWSCVLGDQLLGIFGVTNASFTGGHATLWLLTTDAADRNKLAFFKAAHAGLSKLRSQWREINVGIDSQHNRALRLAWAMGFKLTEKYQHPDTGAPFANHVILGRE